MGRMLRKERQTEWLRRNAVMLTEVMVEIEAIEDEATSTKVRVERKDAHVENSKGTQELAEGKRPSFYFCSCVFSIMDYANALEAEPN